MPCFLVMLIIAESRIVYLEYTKCRP